MSEQSIQDGINRRDFLKRTSLSVIGVTTASGLMAATGPAAVGGVAIVMDREDTLASAAPCRWAVGELQTALQACGINAKVFPDLPSAPANDRCILVAGDQNRGAQEILKSGRVTLPAAAESLCVAQGMAGGRPVLLACARDVRGLVYAVLELADRVRHADVPLAALELPGPVVEHPANVIRSSARCFVSEIEDKPWFHDRAMWREYLSMLASQRFNRFSLTLGIGYNTPRNVTDSYFLFAYPFFLAVPGYEVRAQGLPDAERDRNLDMLRFISDEAVARGLQFQLGLWSHSYEWADSPNVNYRIEGLTPEMHAVYCRDALAALLKTCPGISGLTLRVHGESGVPDGSFDFWRTLFDAVKSCGRRVEIDMHAKSVPQETIALGLATGMPVNLSPKYCGEHMGLPYQPASIRDLEMADSPYHETAVGVGEGSRKFTRYGYGDLLAEDRPYGVLFRIWPGTQRFLLSGDPAMAAGYGRYSSFCGSLGTELLEPLSFKGRKGSGLPGGRCAYADESLEPKYDWEKYLYTYRVWGRLMYNPDSDPDVWQRYLRKTFPQAAEPAGTALAGASRILPLVTLAHGVSANNMLYWPEIYTNMSIVDPNRRHPYTDTPAPKLFGRVSSFDPQLFSSVDEFAGALLKGQASGKYSPLEIAQWLEDLTNAAAANLAKAGRRTGGRGSPEFRRLSMDVSIQAGLGLFFARKLRSAVLWSIHDQTGSPSALSGALKAYRSARQAWADMADLAKNVYATNITYGSSKNLSGQWIDRLPAIDEDIADMQQRLEQKKAGPAGTGDSETVQRAIRAALTRPHRPTESGHHTPPAHFQPGESFAIELLSKETRASRVTLWYRHVNQAERWQSEPMESRDGRHQAVISADYTRTRFPLQYYFEVDRGAVGTGLYPGLDLNLSNQPYFVVRRAT